MNSKFKVGDLVYGYAVFHKVWDYCIVSDIHVHNSNLFGHSKDRGQFYMMNFDTVVPQYIVESPLWKALE